MDCTYVSSVVQLVKGLNMDGYHPKFKNKFPCFGNWNFFGSQTHMKFVSILRLRLLLLSLSHTGWNDLSGTLPHELCYFRDSLEELDLGGGSISGTIPSCLAQMTKLKILGLNDNCFSGAIPEGLSTELPVLERFNIINNGDLYGSLNGFCSETINTEYAQERILAVATECPVPFEIGDDDIMKDKDDVYDGVECDCCICCDRNDYDCYDTQSGHSWKSYNLYPKHLFSVTVKHFDRKKECRTDANKEWIREKCPCYISSNSSNVSNSSSIANAMDDASGNSSSLVSFECTDDCSQEGAEITIGKFWWY